MWTELTTKQGRFGLVLELALSTMFSIRGYPFSRAAEN